MIFSGFLLRGASGENATLSIITRGWRSSSLNIGDLLLQRIALHNQPSSHALESGYMFFCGGFRQYFPLLTIRQFRIGHVVLSKLSMRLIMEDLCEKLLQHLTYLSDLLPRLQSCAVPDASRSYASDSNGQ